MKRSKEVAALGKTELSGRLSELRKELMKMNAQVAIGAPPKKSATIRTIKKNIARVLTAMRRKQ